MASKYWIPAGSVEVKLTPAQLDAAMNWAASTAADPDLPRHVHEIFPQRDNWANGQRRCCTKLVEKGVLKKVGGAGFCLAEGSREHLEFYRYR